MTSYTSPSSSSCAFPSPVILPRVMLSWAVARKKRVLEVWSLERRTPDLQRVKISPGTFEHCPGFQSTTRCGVSNPDWTVGSSWWKRVSHYLPQKKTKGFSGIYKVEEDKKLKNENYYWKLFSFFGNELLNLCTSPRLPSLQPASLQDKKTHLKECCWSFVVLGQNVAHFVIFLSQKKAFYWWLQ